ncbi:MAG TPA: magnesium transporter CorA family protein [Sporichthyaceae bacterium]|nr:magnesium transporter CorA family protein [Sporichthyaceae bacterium]
MRVDLITEDGITAHAVADLPALLAAEKGIVWVDIPACDPTSNQVLSEVFGFHPIAITDCAQRNRMPRVHVYPDHRFYVLHSPEAGKSGHVHYVELDQFVGKHYLVTVHGPANENVQSERIVRETEAVRAKIEAGRFLPSTSYELSHAIVSAIARHMERFLEQATEEVWRLEKAVNAGEEGDPEEFLEDMFRARHGLLAVRTMAAASCEVFGRVLGLMGSGAVPAQNRPIMDDLIDQFSRVCNLADGQKDYLAGVIEHFRARTETKMTIAAERLAVIAVVTLPITAVASVYGMNVIVNGKTEWFQLVAVLVAMVVMSGFLLRWARRQGWW